nr:hypothetical protein [Mobiluncus sp. Marseille-Q7826]
MSLPPPPENESLPPAPVNPTTYPGAQPAMPPAQPQHTAQHVAQPSQPEQPGFAPAQPAAPMQPVAPSVMPPVSYQPMPPAPVQPMPPAAGPAMPPAPGQPMGVPQAAGQPVPPVTGAQPMVGYTNQIPGGAPGQGGIYIAMPKQDGEFMKALKAIFPTFKRIHKSQGDQVVLENLQLKAWWWVMFLLFSLISGLAYSVGVARSADLMVGGFINGLSNSIGAGSISPYSILSFGYWFLVFFVAIIVSFVAVILRAVFVKATVATFKGDMTFLQCCNVVATGLVLPTIALAAIFVIELLPIPFLTMLLVVLLTIAFLGGLFMMELLISAAIRNITRTEKTTALWHSMFLVLCLACFTFVYLILGFTTTTIAIGSSAVSAGTGMVQEGLDNMGGPNLGDALEEMLGQ